MKEKGDIRITNDEIEKLLNGKVEKLLFIISQCNVEQIKMIVERIENSFIEEEIYEEILLTKTTTNKKEDSEILDFMIEKIRNLIQENKLKFFSKSEIVKHVSVKKLHLPLVELLKFLVGNPEIDIKTHIKFFKACKINELWKKITYKLYKKNEFIQLRLHEFTKENAYDWLLTHQYLYDIQNQTALVTIFKKLKITSNTILPIIKKMLICNNTARKHLGTLLYLNLTEEYDLSLIEILRNDYNKEVRTFIMESHLLFNPDFIFEYFDELDNPELNIFEVAVNDILYFCESNRRLVNPKLQERVKATFNSDFILYPGRILLFQKLLELVNASDYNSKPLNTIISLFSFLVKSAKDEFLDNFNLENFHRLPTLSQKMLSDFLLNNGCLELMFDILLSTTNLAVINKIKNLFKRHKIQTNLDTGIKYFINHNTSKITVKLSAGIPFYFCLTDSQVGTLLEIIKIYKKYPDLRVDCLNIFNLLFINLTDIGGARTFEILNECEWNKIDKSDMFIFLTKKWRIERIICYERYSDSLDYLTSIINDKNEINVSDVFVFLVFEGLTSTSFHVKNAAIQIFTSIMKSEKRHFRTEKIRDLVYSKRRDFAFFVLLIYKRITLFDLNQREIEFVTEMSKEMSANGMLAKNILTETSFDDDIFSIKQHLIMLKEDMVSILHSLIKILNSEYPEDIESAIEYINKKLIPDKQIFTAEEARIYCAKKAIALNIQSKLAEKLKISKSNQMIYGCSDYGYDIELLE